jgi:rhamnose transport system substrate-binding protein
MAGPRAEATVAMRPPWRERFFPNGEWVLLLVLAAEGVLFGMTGRNFLTAGNAMEITRLAVELGLLALVLTPIIITGGIDLSIASMMGLAAVVMGGLWRDAGVPLPAAILAALIVGGLGGALNGLMVARLGFPPLIVTLGTYSLFRGAAEGLTRGIENYAGFPPRFLFLGQGYLGGVVPAQTLVLLPAIAAFAWWLHRTGQGRTLYAIGLNAEGARHAGIPVARRVGLLYALSGLLAALAAVVYVAHLGQAKADAGTGFELMAITAVVLGGASIFGGRGTVLGTVLGLFAIVVLQNGLRLSGQPVELAGILTGTLLVATILVDRLARQPAKRAHGHVELGGARSAATSEGGFRGGREHPSGWGVSAPPEIELGGARSAATSEGGFRGGREHPSGWGVSAPPEIEDREGDVRNSQLAALSAVIVGAAMLVAGANWLAVRSLREDLRAAAGGPEAARPAAPRPVVAMMPKAKGDPYFISCRKGAEEAARETGVELLWDGPTDLDPAKQNEVVEAWITRGVDVIAVSVENQVAISTVLRKARDKGIGVITWDADAQPDARDFFINQATPQGIGYTLTDEAGRILGGEGEFAIITASLSAGNQNEWIKHIKARLAEKHRGLKLVAIQPSEGDRDRAFAETQTLLKVYPQVRLVMAIAAPAVPGAAEAVQQSGRKDVKVTGLSLPNMCRPYVHSGVVDSFVLWNTVDLGYLTVHAARALAAGELTRGARSVHAGRLGEVAVEGDNVMLGAPFVFNKKNIDQFDF